MIAKVWYCRRCRYVIKCEPRDAVARGCVCEVPSIGRPTKVIW